MPFKVVQTYEDGDLFVTFCPEQWESGGKLKWPQSMLQGEKLKKKEDSQPGSNWVVLDCEVKRRNLTLAQAKAAVKAMSDLSETEEENERSTSKKRKIRQETKNTCFNDIAEQCINVSNLNKKSSTGNENLQIKQSSLIDKVEVKPKLLERVCPVLENTPSPSFKLEQCLVNTNKSSSARDDQEWKSFLNTKAEILEICETDQVNAPVKQSLDMTQPCPTVYDNNTVVIQEETSRQNVNGVENVLILNQENSTNNSQCDKTDLLFSALVVIQESQKRLETALDCVTKMIVNTDTKFEEFLKRTQDIEKSAIIGMEPIDNKKSLIDFEENLKNPVVESDLKVKFLVVCGVGKGKGINNCYSLVDVMFTRRFLTECSWAGGSRNANQTKVCFKSYERTFNFFFSVIQESDPTFTKVECEAFFKNVLRNSNRRCSAKGLRASAPRVRPKKGKGKNLTKSTADLTKASSSATKGEIKNEPTTADLTQSSSSNTDNRIENNDCNDQNK